MSYTDVHDKTQEGYGSVNNPQDRRKHIDVHEELKKELYKQASLPDPSFTRIVGSFPSRATGGAGVPPPLPALIPTAETGGGSSSGGKSSSMDGSHGVIDRFFFMDSNAKDSSSVLSNGRLVFDIQTLNQSKPIDNIIEMQIGDFFFPEIATSIDYPTYFFFRRIYILIDQMAAQSIFAQGNYRMHFALGVQPAGISNSSIDTGFNKFIFSKPFRDLGLATFRFIKPSYSSDFTPVVFEQDIFTFTAVIGAPLGPNFGGAEIVTTTPHGLNIGADVSIFIKGFASNVSNIDSLINSPDGLLIRVVDATTLEFRAPGTVGFDFSAVGAPVSATLMIGFRRIAFTMRFRSITDGDTNHIVPV